jgi:predicted nuclease with RNAse H fold
MNRLNNKGVESGSDYPSSRTLPAYRRTPICPACRRDCLGALPLGARQAPSTHKERRGLARRGARTPRYFSRPCEGAYRLHTPLSARARVAFATQTKRKQGYHDKHLHHANAANLDTVLHGDCIEVMRHMRPDGHSRPVPTEMAGRAGLAKATLLVR